MQIFLTGYSSEQGEEPLKSEYLCLDSYLINQLVVFPWDVNLHEALLLKNQSI